MEPHVYENERERRTHIRTICISGKVTSNENVVKTLLFIIIVMMWLGIICSLVAMKEWQMVLAVLLLSYVVGQISFWYFKIKDLNRIRAQVFQNYD